MYKAVLVATDGSTQAGRAARAAAALARALGSRLLAIHVTVQGVPTVFSGSKLYDSPALSPALRRVLEREAAAALETVERAARKERLPCTPLRARARHPWRAILAAARRHGCDLIVVGAHGRGGVTGELLGGQTTRLLAHSRIPVLVCR